MRRLLLVLLVVCSLAGCGVPTDDGAETMNDVPFGLLDPQASEPADAAGPAGGPGGADLSGRHLGAAAGAGRAPSGGEGEVSLTDVVDALLDGPTRAERGRG